MQLVEVKSVHKEFNVKGTIVHALQDVSFTLEQGEMIALVGSSGSGKSTLLQMISGLDIPTSGEVLFSGVPIQQAIEAGSFYEKVQLMPQSPMEAMSHRMTIRDFLKEPKRNMPSIPTTKEEILQMIEEVGLAKDVWHRLSSQLSGGQLQRILLVRVLLVRPDLILFDEPTSALDVVSQHTMLELIKRLREAYGFSGIFVTHDLGVAQRISDRIMVMDHGKIVEILDSKDLAQKASHEATLRLLESQL